MTARPAYLVYGGIHVSDFLFRFLVLVLCNLAKTDISNFIFLSMRDHNTSMIEVRRGGGGGWFGGGGGESGGG